MRKSTNSYARLWAAQVSVPQMGHLPIGRSRQRRGKMKPVDVFAVCPLPVRPLRHVVRRPPIREVDMSGVKPKRRRKTIAAPALGVAGLSLSLASGAYGASATAASDMLSSNAVPTQEVALREEEVFDVSLAAFHVLDKENTGTRRSPAPRGKIAFGGCVPDGLYSSETPPAIGGPVYQAPGPNGSRPIRPAHKHVRRKP
jgi:hypothetical protein